jgi:hypothetical protein
MWSLPCEHTMFSWEYDQGMSGMLKDPVILPGQGCGKLHNRLRTITSSKVSTDKGMRGVPWEKQMGKWH